MYTHSHQRIYTHYTKLTLTPEGTPCTSTNQTTPLEHHVPFGHLDLEHLILGHESGEAGQRLPPAPPHAEAEGVALRLAEDPGDARDMLDGIKEHDEVHWCLAVVVVVQKVLLDHPH